MRRGRGEGQGAVRGGGTTGAGERCYRSGMRVRKGFQHVKCQLPCACAYAFSNDMGHVSSSMSLCIQVLLVGFVLSAVSECRWEVCEARHGSSISRG